MTTLPLETVPVFLELAPLFTDRTYRRALVLVTAAILTTGRRTIANLLRTAGTLAQGDPSSYRRVLSDAKWSGLRVACVLTRVLVRRFYPAGVVPLVGDDTVEEHRGKKVFGKGRHRDAVRSSHSYTTFRYGHKWVVLALLVRFPFAARCWALPLAVALYRSPADNRLAGRRHRTPAEILQRLVRLVRRWFPDRPFRLVADSGYGSHAMAKHARRLGLTLVSRFYADANLYEPPPAALGKKKAGRPRVKGKKLPSPAQVVATAPRTALEVAWYGGGRRQVEVVTGVGQWYKSGEGLVEVRWVYVHDRTGTHRDEYFYTTATALTAAEVVEAYTGRWNIETTFQELRAYLGLETTRGWCQATVQRAAPCLFGLYTLVALLYTHLPERKRQGEVAWAGKTTTTFADAITVVRRWLWTEGVFAQPAYAPTFAQLPEDVRDLLLAALAPAA
jgi:hypothetical protein